MKLRNISKGTRAVKAVQFRLANAPLAAAPIEPGKLPEDEYTIKLGVRVLTGGEIADVYQRAQADAFARGVKEWLDTHPLCRLYEMAHTLAVACVDIEAPVEPFFASVEEVLSSAELGGDNIAYIYEMHQAWQDENSPRARTLTVEQVVALIAEEAGRPENAAHDPFLHTKPSLRANLWHSTCVLFATLLKDRSHIGSTDDTSSNDSSKPNEPSESPAE